MEQLAKEEEENAGKGDLNSLRIGCMKNFIQVAPKILQ